MNKPAHAFAAFLLFSLFASGALAQSPINMLRNGDFDTDLANWTTDEDVIWDMEDRDGRVDSGSAFLSRPSIGFEWIRQCINLEGSKTLEVAYSFRFRAFYALSSIGFTLRLHSAPNCGGTLLGRELDRNFADDQAWQDGSLRILAPPETQSALVFIELGSPVGGLGSTEILVDKLSVFHARLLFEDGFEFGDTGAWSSSSF